MDRRAFLRLLSAAGMTTVAGVPLWPRRASAATVAPGQPQRVVPPLFETIDPRASGITWIHENAMSPNRYLPETMGPGVAFLDYDNDGWVDIFMVNSGAAD